MLKWPLYLTHTRYENAVSTRRSDIRRHTLTRWAAELNDGDWLEHVHARRINSAQVWRISSAQVVTIYWSEYVHTAFSFIGVYVWISYTPYCIKTRGRISLNWSQRSYSVSHEVYRYHYCCLPFVLFDEISRHTGPSYRTPNKSSWKNSPRLAIFWRQATSTIWRQSKR